MNYKSFYDIRDHHSIFVWVIFKMKVFMRECDWNVRPLGSDAGSLNPDMLHHSLGFFILPFVARFKSWSSHDRENKLPWAWRRSAKTYHALHHGPLFTRGGRQCWLPILIPEENQNMATQLEVRDLHTSFLIFSWEISHRDKGFVFGGNI